MKDLFVYAADQDILSVVDAVLDSHERLGFRSLTSALDRHPHKDPGMVNTGHEWASELFEYVCLDRARRTISPRDFSQIARSADMTKWLRSKSFAAVVEKLREWFS